MALPKEPRQKMINLMYLVLTALLALNVSAEILNAFKTVNNSLELTNKVVNLSTNTYMQSMEDQKNQPETREKATIWLAKAQQVQAIANAAYGKVQLLKDSILHAAGFNPAKNKDSAFSEDNIDIAQRIIVEGGEGKKLYTTLQQFKDDILKVDPEITKVFNNNPPINLAAPATKNQDKRWEAAYFHMTPTVAALTILSKFQNDIKNAENKAIQECQNQVGHVIVRINKYQAIVQQSSTYLMNGEPIDITAGLGAFNSEKKPTVTIDGQTQAINDSGFVRKSFTAQGVGPHTVHVVVSYTDQDGKPQSLARDVTYTVGEPTGLAISADDVAVLYTGLKNHISVNAGVGAEKVHVSVDNGTVSNGERAGVYIIEPARAGQPANVKVVVDGKGTTNKQFRVKQVPDPVGVVGVNKGGRMRVNEFKAQFGVSALLENFVFEGVKFNVTGYTIVCNGAGFPQLRFENVNGASFDPVRSLIEQCKPGTTVVIDNIKAAGPGGTRNLPPIAYTLF